MFYKFISKLFNFQEQLVSFFDDNENNQVIIKILIRFNASKTFLQFFSMFLIHT